MALIALEKAQISYEGVTAVRDASFAVEKGDYLVIIGENGSGKSSVMKAMLGLVKLRSGMVRYGDGLRKNQIGYLPQQTQVQRDFPASVEEVVFSGLVSRAGGHVFLSKALKERALANMEMIGILPLRKKPYRALSGGQQQRALLARAMCATDSLLLLDEPVTGLDPQATEEMYDIIRTLNGRGVAIATVSHDVRGALRDARHVLVMNNTVGRYLTIGEYALWRETNE